MVARITANRADGFIGKVAWSARSVYSQKRGINPTHLGPLTTGQAIKFFPVGLYYNVIDRIKSPVFGITLSDPLTHLATANGAGLEQTQLARPKPENIMLSTGASTGSGSADKPKLVKPTMEKRSLRLIPNMVTSLLYGIAAGSLVPTATIVAANMLSAATLVNIGSAGAALPLAYPILAATGFVTNFVVRLVKHQGIKNAFTNRINLALAAFGVVSFAASSASAILASILPASFIVSTAFATIMIALPFVIGGLPLALHISSIIRNKAGKETIDINNQPAAGPVTPENRPATPTVYEDSVAGLGQALKDLRLELAKGATADADALSHLRSEAKRVAENLSKADGSSMVLGAVDLKSKQQTYIIYPNDREEKYVDPTDPREGERKFPLGKLLGSGGMAQVYEAVDLSSGQLVAVKYRAIDIPAINQRFEVEAKTIMIKREELKSGNAAQRRAAANIADVLARNNDVFFVEELLSEADGWTPLNLHLMLVGSLPMEEAIHLAIEIAFTMDQLSGLHHRDLKPANIFYNPKTKGIKIVDFGLLKIIGDIPGVSTDPTSTHVFTGTPSASAPWFASEYSHKPEAFRNSPEGEKLLIKNDIYGIACVLYRLLTGSPLFYKDDSRYFTIRGEKGTGTEIRPNIWELPLEVIQSESSTYYAGPDSAKGKAIKARYTLAQKPPTKLAVLPDQIYQVLKKMSYLDHTESYASFIELIRALEDALREEATKGAKPADQPPPLPSEAEATLRTDHPELFTVPTVDTLETYRQSLATSSWKIDTLSEKDIDAFIATLRATEDFLDKQSIDDQELEAQLALMKTLAREIRREQK